MFDTPDDFNKSVEDYFESLDPASPATITGLAYHLGFESRQSFYDYEKRDGFSYIVKRARLKIESCYETRLNQDKPAGPIFALKNMGWSDKQEIDQKTEISGSMVFTGIEMVRPDATDQEIPS